jgi:GLPGLI family protein
MKKWILVLMGAGLVLTAAAQQKEGRVVYERTMQLQIRFSGGPGSEHLEQMMPKSKTDKLELLFGNDQTLWRALPDDEAEESSFGGNGMQVRMMVAGADDVLYTHLGEKRKVELKELFEKKFLIADSIKPLKWKMTGQTKMVLGKNCQQAMATNIQTRTQMINENGTMSRKEISDTMPIIAWFTPEIPVTAGPGEYQTQLPGLILEMDISNGRQVYKALEISPKVELASIKEPAGKKKITAEEYKVEREKLMQEMQMNMGGGGPGRTTIRIN